MSNNPNNIIPNSQRTPEERREIARKGGIASGKARLRKKHGRELVRALLSMPEKDPRILEEMARLGILEKDATNEVVMHIRQLERAKRKTDTKSYNAILKAAGYMEDEHHEQGVTLNIVVNNPDEREKIANIGDLKV